MKMHLKARIKALFGRDHVSEVWSASEVTTPKGLHIFMDNDEFDTRPNHLEGKLKQAIAVQGQSIA